ncbi:MULTISPECIES: ABC transporter ATP-binding protein [Lysinibacillus]|jgi:oligopeptide/dipeptide ABC transporter ATP-binding protein|uniref:ABC transporter ATP-binding protein n=1 Tax=Lysinibacillus TaxID=400634 RepID=UPI0004D70A08|nr:MULTISPECIES: dipeptide ABC transporter ATP-binding protein [Lysinibacillus]MDC6267491.1 dipeptide ABC transporter ATP-binding protein [Lysinibacillus sphaericus]AJK87327.1 peptide ABC transporter substrate-binding protein [Lysinibacillus fusiformis]KHK53265.1 peptide ABC transporter substrate-binding protein [Lysinibacillus sp. A1]MCE4044294.1 dipeptide ABC transporter ATP-binding protein [Lysinibacillus fusiformis]MCT6927072.1 dipeptide ABC transporter ATP-binding protein [Lysinibacillus 
MSEVLLEVQNLKTYFPINKSFFSKNKDYVKAVDGVTFKLFKGETLGIVGESGCGKSTTGRSILKLIEPTSGNILFEGKDVLSLSKQELRKLRKQMQIVFQDPFASLNPRLRISSILEEALLTHGIGATKKERRQKVIEILQMVGLGAFHADRYPHEFSGGQRQRIGIARAIAVGPSLIIADEPVSALDVSVQAQILNLFQSLQKELELTYIFIAHDLSVVKHISDRIGVMYLGRMVEFADKNQLFADPLHPYTKSLMSSVPIPNPESEKKDRIILTGDVPNPVNPPLGCTFHPRCFACMEVCRTKKPRNIEVKPGHFVACHLFEPERMVVRD